MKIIQKTIKIDAPVDKVWRVFTDATVTIKLGGAYITDWKVGSSFGWKGQDGEMYTNGVILKIEKEKLIEHNLFDHEQKVLSVITYRFVDDDHQTTLHVQEKLNYEPTEKLYQDALAGWDFALASVKKVAEEI